MDGRSGPEAQIVFVGGGGPDHAVAQGLRLDKANRHGLIAGATGTGKTVTVQVLAEGFSAAGVPVLVPDVKGDLAGLAMAGAPDPDLRAGFADRAARIGHALSFAACPVTFWDVFGAAGHPLRATLGEIGPLLLAQLLELTEPQEGVLNIAFRVADEQGLPVLDLADLRALLVWVGENRAALALRYGTIAPASVGAIQRRLLVLEQQGAAAFFGEPALDLADLMAVTPEGRGRVSVLAADRLMGAPRLYATVMLWLLSDLFETLPEVGDPEKPRLVVVFDEAHLLFAGAPRALVERVEQVARLIRSKGVGVIFCTQLPDDVPPAILGQLGNRIQHALRAFTARDRRALRAAAETYRDNPALDIEAAIREVGTGEAVTSFLDAKGLPGMAERTLVRPPASRMGVLTAAERAAVIAASPVAGKYETALDRDSAHEMLARRAAEAAQEAARAEDAAEAAGPREREFTAARRYSGAVVGRSTTRSVPARRSDGVAEAFAKSFARQFGTQSGRAVARGVLGGLFRGR